MNPRTKTENLIENGYRKPDVQLPWLIFLIKIKINWYSFVYSCFSNVVCGLFVSCSWNPFVVFFCSWHCFYCSWTFGHTRFEQLRHVHFTKNQHLDIDFCVLFLTWTCREQRPQKSDRVQDKFKSKNGQVFQCQSHEKLSTSSPNFLRVLLGHLFFRHLFVWCPLKPQFPHWGLSISTDENVLTIIER